MAGLEGLLASRREQTAAAVAAEQKEQEFWAQPGAGTGSQRAKPQIQAAPATYIVDEPSVQPGAMPSQNSEGFVSRTVQNACQGT